MLWFSAEHKQGAHYATFQKERYCLYAYTSTIIACGHESSVHGPLFSAHRNARRKGWCYKTLAMVWIISVWSEAATQRDRFASTREQLSMRTLGKTYQGFMKAAKRWSPRLLRLIADHWLFLVQTVAGAYWKTGGWVVFACDGSKIDLPRTAANEKAFGISGKNNSSPQSMICMMQHLRTGLPWCWKIGKTSSSERGLLRQMFHTLPAESLLVADAGFTGYDLWQTLDDAGQSFLIRVGGNVRLLKPHVGKLKTYDGVVYLWPKDAQKKGHKPIVLRLLSVRDGRKTMYLVTNVLDERKLTDRQMAQYYQWRWGVELWFRTMKQTLKRQKMRSHAPVQAALELRWTILGVAMLELITAKAQIERGHDPWLLSAAEAVRVIRRLMRRPDKRAGRKRLVLLLSKAVIDGYVRKANKNTRPFARKRKHRTAGRPKITLATESQVQLAQRLMAA